MSIMMAMMGSLGGTPPAVDKSGLFSALNAAAALVEGNYTPASWAGLQDAVDAGELVYSDAEATQIEVDVAAQDIIDAIDALVPAVIDPYFNNVSLLLHLNGANLSTDIIDSSPRPKTAWASANRAWLSTDQFKFPPSSAYFDGSNYISSLTTSQPDFVLGDTYTVEMYIRSDGGSTNQGIWIAGDYADNTRRVQGELFPNGSINFFWQAGSGVSTGVATDPLLISASQWYHIAFVREGDEYRIYVAGNLSATHTSTISFTERGRFNVGVARSGSQARLFRGYIDEVRVTKGVARYTANFTPPSAPFPDS